MGHCTNSRSFHLLSRRARGVARLLGTKKIRLEMGTLFQVPQAAVLQVTSRSNWSLLREGSGSAETGAGTATCHQQRSSLRDRGLGNAGVVWLYCESSQLWAQLPVLPVHNVCKEQLSELDLHLDQSWGLARVHTAVSLGQSRSWTVRTVSERQAREAC